MIWGGRSMIFVLKCVPNSVNGQLIQHQGELNLQACVQQGPEGSGSSDRGSERIQRGGGLF